MRKKLIALSVALLTIGGSLTFTSTARADVTSGQYVFASICQGQNGIIFYNAEDDNPVHLGDSILSTTYNDRFYGFPTVAALSFTSLCPINSHYHGYSNTDSLLASLVSQGKENGVVPQALLDAFDSEYYGFLFEYNFRLAVLGVVVGVSHYQLVNFGCGGGILDAVGETVDLVNISPTGSTPPALCTPYTALTLPPDFLTPKTYGNPASVTGYAPALPATPVTPTAPVITASATSVIYNGVPQSAPYSVDQKSSCSTTYNGSAIPPVAAGTYAVSITCSANSLTSTATTTLTITKASPVISWSTPSAITSTTKLGASQLNAFSYIPGSFTYSASAGSSLPQGDILVTATFTPTDTTNYTSATETVTMHVTP